MRRLRLTPLLVALGALVLLCAAAAPGSTVFSSSGSIAVNECCNGVGDATGPSSAANPYGTGAGQITLPGTVSGVIQLVKVNVTLAFNFPQDLDVLLVGPGNRTVMLMSDTGGNSNTFVPDSLTFDDAAGGVVPDTGELISGTYRPTNNGTDCDNQTESVPETMPAGPPVGPYGSQLSTFNGLTAANSVWNLYVADDCNGIGPDQTIPSWSLDITSGPATAVHVKTFTARRVWSGIALTWRTAKETDLLGFNVFRSNKGKWTRVNSRLIGASGTGPGAGASYRLLDTRARTGITYTYRLESIALNGRHSWQGFARVSPN